MSGMRDIKIRFSGDTSSFGKASDDVKKKTEDMASGFDKANDAADQTYSKFDALESVGRGTTDTMSGLAAIMKGDVLGGATDLAGGVAALADGFTGALLPGIKAVAKAGIANTVQNVRQTASTVAHRAAMIATSAASKAAAAAQWLLNAALTANPIGLVIAAIAALVAIFIVAYKKSETFRKIVNAALTGVKVAAQAVARFFVEKVWPWIQQAWNGITRGVTAVKNRIVGDFNAAVAFVRGLPGRIAAGARGIWNGITGGLAAANQWVTDKLLALVRFVTGMPGRIGRAASGMFNGIKTSFKSAVNWLIGKWNGLSFGISGKQINILGQQINIPGFRLSTPNIPYLAKGGRITRAGFAVVGDAGPELLHLPGGAAVQPLPAAAGGGMFEGTLVLDSGAFLGMVRGEIRARDRNLKRRVSAGTGGAR